MTVSKDNKRVFITMPVELLNVVVKIAEKENRTVSNWIVTIIKKELEKTGN